MSNGKELQNHSSAASTATSICWSRARIRKLGASELCEKVIRVGSLKTNGESFDKVFTSFSLTFVFSKSSFGGNGVKVSQGFFVPKTKAFINQWHE
jgi:hypothetical protein